VSGALNNLLLINLALGRGCPYSLVDRGEEITKKNKIFSNIKKP
jgi:hypothetical protein